MKIRALSESLRMVSKVISDPSIGSDQRDQLLKAKRELEKLARSGKLDERKVFRAVELVTSVLLGIVEDEVTRR